jgi:hypothetical protein
MLDVTSLQRRRYVPSGKFDVARFCVGAILLLLASCVGGVVSILFYSVIALSPILLVLTFFVPIVIGISIAWLVAKFVDYSYCRNRLVAALVGAICGAVAFLSASQIVGVVVACREVERPVVLAIARRTDLIKKVIVSRIFSVNNKSQQPDVDSHFSIPGTVILLLELGILMGIPAKAGFKFAGRAYGESIDDWLTRLNIRAIPGSGDKIVSALQDNQSLSKTLASIQLSPTDPFPANPKFFEISRQQTENSAVTRMVLEFSPFKPFDGEYEAYLTATEFDAKGNKTILFQRLKLHVDEYHVAKDLFTRSLSDWKTRETVIDIDQLKVEKTERHTEESANTAVHGI